MESSKKKTGKRIAMFLLLIVLAGIVAAGALFLQKEQISTEKGASILSTHVKKGSIQKTLSGTGTLTEQDPQAVSVLQGVKVTEYLVKNGQIVKKGDPVATVNRASVMVAISSLRDVMKEVSADIDTIQSTPLTTTVTAAATGRVKAIYASEGEQVQDVLLRDGALAILSLDGLMAAKIPAETSVSIGQTVNVILADGEEVNGRVEAVREGIATVTIDDTYGSIDEQVEARTDDGRLIGRGSLYVHSAWKAFASEGLVYGVYLYEGQMAEAGVVLFRVDLPQVNGGYESFAAEHREYEELLADLFRIYYSGMITAPCDGYVSGVDDGILKQLSSGENGYRLQLLAYESDSGGYGTRVGMVTQVNSDGSISALMQSWDTEIVDFMQTGTVETSADTMTQPYSASYPYAFTWDGSQWQRKNIEVGDVYLFASDNSDLSMMVYVGHNNVSPVGSDDASSGKDSSAKESSSGKSDSTEKKEGETEKEESSDSQKSSGSGSKSGSGGSSGSGGASNTASGSGTEESKTVKRYDTTGTTILTVTPQETVSITITVDELDVLAVHAGQEATVTLDVLAVHAGQEATVTLDALTGQSFKGIITKVDTTATNEGGNTKYSATVQLEKEGLMLGGMNASASIILEDRENVLLIPSEALIEQNGKSAVYTAYNERTGILSNPVEVETGLSDGMQVEIISDLKEGDTIWYSYYDKLEIDGLTV